MSHPRRPLRALLLDGEDIQEDILREAWSLRVEMLRLVRNEQEDWAIFSGFVRGADRTLLCFVDEHGTLQGFFSLAYLPVDACGRRMLLMYSKYFYFRRAYRGHATTLLAPWRLLPRILRRYGARSLHLVTTAFPQSYVSLSRSSGGVHSLRDEDLPEWARDALLAFVGSFCSHGYDEQQRLVGGNNVPNASAIALSAEAAELNDRFEQLNPRWREGFALPILFSVNHRLVAHSARRLARRLRPRPNP